MAIVPSTDNICNVRYIKQRFDSINIFEKNIVKTEHNPHLFDEYYEDYVPEPQVYENMKDSSLLTKQAKDILSSIEGEIVFVNEKYNTGDFNRYSPDEFWILYVLVLKVGIITRLKFYRDFYVHDGEKKEDIPYNPQKLTNNDFGIFEEIFHQLYPSDINVIYNSDPSNLTKSAQDTIAFVNKYNFGNIFFTAEEEKHGKSDQNGPLNYIWTLYIFIQNHDGSIVRRIYLREYHRLHDNCNMDDVPYESYQIEQMNVFKKFVF
jgi:hypothetical protein